MSKFLWGVATSAYQSEGGYNGVGQPQTNWAHAEAQGAVMPSGRAADFWNRYQEDFARCREMGLNSFRIGIEWSRVQPQNPALNQGGTEFDLQALDHYAAMLASCRKHGLEPVLTLHHFVHPAWLGTDPWLEPSILPKFTRFVQFSLTHINRALVHQHALAPVLTYITINEPNMLALNTYFGNQFPGTAPRGLPTVMSCYNQLLGAHVYAYNAIHNLHAAEGWPAARVTLNTYCSDLYWSDKILLDLLSVRERGIPQGEVGTHIVQKAREFNAAFANARIPLQRNASFIIGALVKRVGDCLGHRFFHAKNFAPLLDIIYSSPRSRLMDFVGLDYYDPFMAHAFRLPVWWDHEFKNHSFRAWIMASVSSKWWDWRVLPKGLSFFCQYYSADLGHLPVLIAENGMALRRKPNNLNSPRRDRFTRSRFLELHVAEVVRIANSGVPLFGYLHWSLFDNYEWGSYTPRFGLFSIDYTHKAPDRLGEDQLGDRPAETYTQLVRNANIPQRDLENTQNCEANIGR